MSVVYNIAPPRHDLSKVLFPEGNTADIITTVMYADQRAAAYTRNFAKQLQGPTVKTTAFNIWRWLKTEITYQLDPKGIQNIKSPGRFFADSTGDCKSYSVFTGSILRNLGIPYKYRFASYKSYDPTPTHVFIVIPGPQEIIIDAVWKGRFNTTEITEHKTDRDMSSNQISGIGNRQTRLPGTLVLTKDPDQLLDGELDLLLAQQATEIARDNAIKNGHTRAIKGYNAQLGVINECLACIHNPDHIHGIGSTLIGKAKKKGGKTKAGKLLQKIGKGLKKGVKAITKVATLPARLALKGAMEIYLPKASVIFLYLFSDPKITLPDLAKRKQAKAEKFKKFVVSGLGMKEKHFMAIVRNALTKRFGKSPEAFLAEKFKLSAVNGIGKANRKKAARKLQRAGGRVTLQPNLPELTSNPSEVLQRSATAITDQVNANGQATVQAGKTIANSLFKGDIIGAAISAITWLISKIGGKKNKEEEVDLSFSEADFPDPDNDLQNAFQYADLKTDFSKVPEIVKEEIKQVVTEMIVEQKPMPVAAQEIRQQFPQLDTSQVRELVSEVEEGPEPITEDEAFELATDIKKSANADDRIKEENGGGSKGFCGGLFG